MRERPTLIVAGVSTRALAQSAARAGVAVTAIDAFGDLDLRAAADVVTIRRGDGTPWSPEAAAHASRARVAHAVAYTSNFENAPDAVAALARGRALLGNGPDVLRAVRNPLLLMSALRARGFATPATRAGRPPRRIGPRAGWLLKPRGSGGGHGVRRWDGESSIPRASYLQERITGLPGSIVFAADGRQSRPLGLTRQLVGDRAFGAQGFRYCGSLLCPGTVRVFARQAKVAACAAGLAQAATEAFGLLGLNGLDFIARGGVAYPIEVNPRWSASMELVERAHGLNLFDLHQRACHGELPASTPFLAAAPVEGKAIVFASNRLIATGTRRWLSGPYADVPAPGERIEVGHPICTVFARGRDARTCHAALARRAAGVAAPGRGVDRIRLRGAA